MALGDFLFPHLELKLVIAHSFEVDIEAEKDKRSKEYQDLTARASFSKTDFQRLGITEGGSVNIKSKASQVVVSGFIDERLESGLASMPHGPWALSLVEVPIDGSPLKIHGIQVTVTKTNDKVTSLDSLLEVP
ncbi:MAG: molybdopterin dinucleotide binding domain-containing protein [Candidatus Thorarchaeota archaeon]|jgi:formylmethanofuran dehydrogenase subunit D